MRSRFFSGFNLIGDFPKDDLVYALFPLHKICNLCGVCPLELQFNYARVCIFKPTRRTIFYSLIAIAVMTVGFVHSVILVETVHSYVKYERNFISVFTAWGQIYVLYGVAILAMILSIIQCRTKADVYHTLRSIDKRLISLGTTVNYVKRRRNMIYAMLVFSSMPFVFSMVNCSVVNSNYDAYIVCYVFICVMPMSVVCLIEFQYYNLISMVKDKLEAINKHLILMAKPILRVSPRLGAFSVQRYDETNRQMIAELKKIGGIYMDLIGTTTKIQEVFGVYLLLMISSSFLVITIQTYNIFSLIMGLIKMSTFRIFTKIAWMIIQSFAIVMNIHVCSKARKAMSNTGPLLHNIQCLSDNRQVFQTAHMFSLQILHRNIHFTAAGFFNLDYKLITSIVGAVTTYLVIIIQFHISNTQNHIFGGEDPKVNLTESI